ncbi:hypothetical protein HYV85_02750 [Candidatus Woesearchaeota archaeon]|nr:hypothetical protein [Candidatus Woesearchaeota archaeon]
MEWDKEQTEYYQQKRKELAAMLGLPEEEVARGVVEQSLKPEFQRIEKALYELADALVVAGKKEGVEFYVKRLKVAIETLISVHLPLEVQLQLLDEIKKSLPTINKLLKEGTK